MTNYGKHKSNAFVALEQSEEYNYTQTKVKAVINALKINQEKYKPEMTTSYIEEFCKDDRFTRRFFYSNISDFVFGLVENEETVIANTDYLLRYAYKNKNKISDDCFQFVIRLYDHISLAVTQREMINNSFDKKIELTKENIKTDTKKIEKHYITILGIFAAIVLTFVGEFAFSTSVLQNITSSNYKIIMIAASLIGLIFVDGLYGLFYFICKIIDIELKLGIKFLLIINITIAVLGILFVCVL